MAIASTIVWECRTSGSDQNSGGFKPGSTGVDLSQQDAAQYSVADGVTAGTTTITSATANFGTDVVGNLIYVAGGTGSVTAGWYEITARGSATSITVDRSTGLTAGTGVTLKIGGAILSPGIVAANIAAGNTVYVKSGTYNCSSSSNVASGRVSPAVQSRWVGYVTTRGDAALWGTMPSLKATSNSMTIFAPSANDVSVENIEFDGDKANRTSVAGCNPTSTFRIRAINSRVKNCNNRGFGSAGVWSMWFCEANNCATFEGITITGMATGCIVRDSTRGFSAAGAGTIFNFCATINITEDGFRRVFALNCNSCITVLSGGNGFDLDTAGSIVVNSIAYGTTGVGFYTSTAQNDVIVYNSAGGANTGGNFHSTDIPTANKPGFVTLTADPFVAKASLNFALNTAAGGGAALRGLGIGTFPGSATTGYPDVGAVQHADPAAGGVNLFQSPVIRAA